MAGKLGWRHSDAVKDRIKVVKIVEKLQSHVFGECELTKTQIQAAVVLLNKTMSNAPTQVGGDPDGSPLTIQLVRYAGSHDPA